MHIQNTKGLDFVSCHLYKMIYFMNKGYKADDITYYDTRLDKLTGELLRIMRPTEKFLRGQFENTEKLKLDTNKLILINANW